MSPHKADPEFAQAIQAIATRRKELVEQIALELRASLMVLPPGITREQVLETCEEFLADLAVVVEQERNSAKALTELVGRFK